MPKNIDYRQATILDLPNILSLIQRSKAHFHPQQDDYVNEFVLTWGPNAYYIEDHTLLIAMESERMIGVIGLRGPTEQRQYAELDMLFVDSSLIGQGYGRLLWNKAVAHAKAQSWPTLQFISDKIPMIVGFYEHMGAKTTDILALKTGKFPVMSYSVC